MAPRSNNPPLIVIVGETGSGKSELAMDLAKRFNGEIIAADSWTVYRGFDIGTAKPSRKERDEIPHHLLDVTDASRGYSAAVFKKRAMEIINEVAARGKLPLLVGGSGLYIDSVLYDYEFLPAPSPQLRQELNSFTLVELLKRAEDQGLITDTIDTRNKRRVMRLIENNGVQPQKHNLRPHTLMLGVAVPPEELQARIGARVQTMLRAGLEAEVRQLAGKYSWDMEPMKGIGYREFKPYIEGTQSLDETIDRIIQNTLALAKKQRTWFQRNKSIHWLDEQAKAVAYATTFLNK